MGLLEVSNSHIIVQLSVFQVETTWGPRNEQRWREVLLFQEMMGGAILTTSLTSKMVILQGRMQQKLDSKELKVQHKT